MNKLIAVGRLGNDAEQRFLDSGTAILSFSVAVDVGFGDKKMTQWYRCALFGKRAEGSLKDYLTKGQQVVIEGSPKLNEYTTKDGDSKASIEVNLDDVTLVGGRPDESTQATAPVQQPVHVQQSIDVTEDVPFANPYVGKYYAV